MADSVELLSDQVIADFAEERRRQHQKWGEQNHAANMWLAILMEEVGEVAKASLETKEAPTLDMAKVRAANYYDELIQVAAVALAAADSFNRNTRPLL
jgi:NTP pyrophosphatase (non-canonical NTP hydrolase)